LGTTTFDRERFYDLKEQLSESWGTPSGTSWELSCFVTPSLLLQR